MNIFIGLVVFFVSCKKDDSVWQVQNLNPNNKTFAFGHGGMGTKYRYPMNSKESLKKVLSIGADGTEMDLQLSEDNQLVLFHNINLQDATNGNGLVRNNTWQAINNVEYKFPIINKTKLIRLQDYFEALVPDANHIFTFDCKIDADEDNDYLNNFANVLYQFIENHHLENNCFIESYNTKFLQVLSSKNSKLKLFVHSNNITDAFVVANQVKLYGLTIDRLKISKEEIELAHQNDLHVTLYNMVNAKENLKAIQMNADFLQSDKMEELIEALK